MNDGPVDLDRVIAELEKSAVFLFRKKGKSRLRRNDFIYEPSLELDWFDPPKGRTFFHNLLSLNVITADDEENYSLNVTDRELPVSMDFRPIQELILCGLSEEMIAAATRNKVPVQETPVPSPSSSAPPSPAPSSPAPPSSLTPSSSSFFEKLLDELAATTRDPKETIQLEINEIGTRNPALEPVVCALLYAQKKGVLERGLVDGVFRELVDGFRS